MRSAGDPDRKLEVLKSVTDADVAETRRLIGEKLCKVELIPGESGLHIILTAGARR